MRAYIVGDDEEEAREGYFLSLNRVEASRFAANHGFDNVYAVEVDLDSVRLTKVGDR